MVNSPVAGINHDDIELRWLWPACMHSLYKKQYVYLVFSVLVPHSSEAKWFRSGNHRRLVWAAWTIREKRLSHLGKTRLLKQSYSCIDVQTQVYLPKYLQVNQILKCTWILCSSEYMWCKWSVHFTTCWIFNTDNSPAVCFQRYWWAHQCI